MNRAALWRRRDGAKRAVIERAGACHHPEEDLVLRKQTEWFRAWEKSTDHPDEHLPPPPPAPEPPLPTDPNLLLHDAPAPVKVEGGRARSVR